jgi:DNA-binding LytR/AlgR family response regulator
MVNVLICNGSLKESDELREKILQCCSDRIKATIFFEDKDAFLFYLEEHRVEPSIIIIELEFCREGLKIAQKAKDLSPWAEIIFLCTKGKWTTAVYDVEHVYGLECPLSEEKLELAINRALSNIDEKRNTLFPVKKKGTVYAIPIKEIRYLEQDKRVINLHTKDEIHSLYVKFADIEKYRTDYFVRCHSSYAVNFFYVKSMTDQHFMMTCGKKIPISRSRKNETKGAYEAFINRQPIPSLT